MINALQFLSNPTITIWVLAGSIPAAQIGAWVTQKTGQRLLRLFLIILLGLILARVIGGQVFKSDVPEVQMDAKGEMEAQ